MAYNNYQQAPFWDFVRSMDQNGAGVDHAGDSFDGFGQYPPPPPPPPHPSHPPHPSYPPYPPHPSYPGHPGHPAGAHPPPPPPPPGAFFPGFPFGGWGGPQGHFPGGFPGRGGFGGPGPHGRGGYRGRHGRSEHPGDENERPRSRTASPSGDHPEGEGPDRPSEGPRRGGRHCRGRAGYGGAWGHHARRGPPPFAGPGGIGGFDLTSLFDALGSHPIGQQPWAQTLRQYVQQAGLAGDGQRSGQTLVQEESDDTFTPPIDIFSTETSYVLHIALPGAKKEDVGVNWDTDKGELNIAGVVYRHGDEEFLKSLIQSERKVGVFERSIKLPPGNEEKEEVDGDGITAKLDDGVLVVTVPKVEKEWTEVKRVDVK